MDYSPPEMFVFPSCNVKQVLDHNNSFHKSFHSIWMFSLMLEGKGSDFGIESICSIKHVFIPISSGSEYSSKRSQKMAFSAAIVASLLSPEQSVQHTTFLL